MDYLISNAWAQAEGVGGSSMFSFGMIAVMFVVFYFLLIRPQSKRQKEHRGMVEALAAGDEIVTSGGLLGEIIEVGEQFLTVQVADGVKLKIQKHTIGALMPKGTMKSS